MRVTLGALAIVASAGLRFAAAQSSDPQSTDYEFFKTRVQPIFLMKRAGHARCVVCHAGAGNGFSLQRLAAGATNWTEEQTKRNYAVVSRLVTPGNPDWSPLLLHPLAPEAGGDPFHSGGRQFESRNDPQWKVMAEWVRQKPPVEYSNLQVLKAGPQVVAMMRSFNFALGGNCAFCHVPGDFASDANRMKPRARQMIQMTEMLDASLGNGAVTCYTCHRGERAPKTAPNFTTGTP